MTLQKWRRGWDYTRRNLLLGRVGMRFFDTATYCIPRIYFEPSQALINKAFACNPEIQKIRKSGSKTVAKIRLRNRSFSPGPESCRHAA